MYTSTEMRKRNLIYLRSMLTLVMILLWVYNYEMLKTEYALPLIYAFILVISNFVFMYLPAQMFRGIKVHYLIFILDMAFIVTGAMIFTNFDITFIIAIFLTVFMAALSHSVGISVLIALVVNALYIYIVYLTGNDNFSIVRSGILLNIPFIFIVALESTYLAEKADEEEKSIHGLEKINVLLTKRITTKSKEIESASDFIESMCESFKDGVIIIDTEGFVRMYNKAAQEIFGLKKDKALGLSVKELSALGEIKEVIMELVFTKKEAINHKVIGSVGGKTRNLSIDTVFIKDKEGDEMGILCNVKEKK